MVQVSLLSIQLPALQLHSRTSILVGLSLNPTKRIHLAQCMPMAGVSKSATGGCWYPGGTGICTATTKYSSHTIPTISGEILPYELGNIKRPVEICRENHKLLNIWRKQTPRKRNSNTTNSGSSTKTVI